MSEKLCMFCANWTFDGGDPGYLSWTPGWSARMGCRKGHLKDGDLMNLDEDSFRKQMLFAETCPDYEQVKP